MNIAQWFFLPRSRIFWILWKRQISIDSSCIDLRSETARFVFNFFQKFLQVFSRILLRCNWHTVLSCTFKIHGVIMWLQFILEWLPRYLSYVTCPPAVAYFVFCCCKWHILLWCCPPVVLCRSFSRPYCVPSGCIGEQGWVLEQGRIYELLTVSQDWWRVLAVPRSRDGWAVSSQGWGRQAGRPWVLQGQEGVWGERRERRKRRRSGEAKGPFLRTCCSVSRQCEPSFWTRA